jgi:hypothetical protein
MPKEGAMMQLSRPFQIVLVTFCLFAAVWFFALRSHSASTSGGGSSPPSAASPAAQPATPSTPYHGSAPGVAGLTRAIEKAQGAVTQSEQHAKRLQQKSAEASHEPSGGTAPNTSKAGAGAAHAVTPKAAASVPKAAATVPKAAAAVPKSATTAPTSAASTTAGHGAVKSKANATPVMQATVEGALKRGKLVTVLFWNPKGIVDRVVHSELQSVGRSSGGKVAVFAAVASQVGSFGSFTKAVQVNGTPTIVIVNPHGHATTLTGLTDVFSIEQAIGEAKK